MVDDPPAAPAPPICPDCGAEVAPALLACPACHRLVHAAELKRLAGEADQAKQTGDAGGELAAWRQALELLPPDTAQHQTVAARVAELSRAVDRQPAGAKRGSRMGKGAAGGLGALGLLLAKFKFALLFVITKAKLLLLGLTKASTLLSMLLSMGVYWTLWGWKFAAGFVVSIYIHEMGHVQALTHYGIKATAPMFIPGVGAFIRLKQYPTDRRRDLGRDCARGRVHQSLQPVAGVAARRRARIPSTDSPATLDRRPGGRAGVAPDGGGPAPAAGGGRGRRRVVRRRRARARSNGLAAIHLAGGALIADDQNHGARRDAAVSVARGSRRARLAQPTVSVGLVTGVGPRLCLRFGPILREPR